MAFRLEFIRIYYSYVASLIIVQFDFYIFIVNIFFIGIDSIRWHGFSAEFS